MLFILLSIMVAMPTLPLAVESCHLAPATWGFDYFHCIQVSQFSACSSHFEVWPTEKNNYRGHQGCRGSHHKFIPPCIGERCVFWTLPVWMIGFTWLIYSTISVFLNLWIPSTLNQDMSGIFNLLIVGHLLVCVSANQPKYIYIFYKLLYIFNINIFILKWRSIMKNCFIGFYGGWEVSWSVVLKLKSQESNWYNSVQFQRPENQRNDGVNFSSRAEDEVSQSVKQKKGVNSSFFCF